MESDMENWDGPERRKNPVIQHVTCAKENEWGELRATMRGILDTQRRMELKQEQVLREIFGNGHDGLKLTADRNKQGLKRAWWWLGAVSVGIILSAIKMALS